MFSETVRELLGGEWQLEKLEGYEFFPFSEGRVYLLHIYISFLCKLIKKVSNSHKWWL